MGPRLSKTTSSLGPNVTANNKSQRKRNSTKVPATAAANISSQSHPSPSTFALNLSQEYNLITNDSRHICFEALTDPDSPSNGPQQIIIKIQLAKMESGDSDYTTPSSSSSGRNGATCSSNNNLNVERLAGGTISFQRNITCDQEREIKLSNLGVTSSLMMNNNNFDNLVNNFNAMSLGEEDSDGEGVNWTNVRNINGVVRKVGNCLVLDRGNNNDSGSNRDSMSSSEYSDAIHENEPVVESKHKSHRRKKTSSSSSSVATPSSRSKYFDALSKIRPSSSKKQNNNQTTKAVTSSSSSSSRPISDVWTPAVGASTSSASSSSSSSSPSGEQPATLAIRSLGGNVIIPLTSPPKIVLFYPQSSVTWETIDDHAIRLLAAPPTTPESSNSMAVSPGSSGSSSSTVISPIGPVVHSQVDYIHCLVPDLEKITKSTFYWGKMDRYEAERLLEGKPEGTFLLRDSAQEEFLFSVTFRKYGRSLHARIEQLNHRFSFDCHDPGVFTADTVTGLLEHYKDPSCVMFFEPMLTIPLHRTTTFSLQQLCRATIVSHTTYDGISDMEIPSRLKSYLKEYHYKQRVRVKPFDEPLYSCT